MKILQILPTLSAGGAESFITRLCCELQSKKLADVVLFIPGGVRDKRGEALYAQLKNSGVLVYGYAAKPMRSPLHFINLIRLIAKHKPDVVQANLFAADILCLAASLFFKFSRTRFVRRLANTNIPASNRPWLAKRLHNGFHGIIHCSGATEEAYSSFMRDIGSDKSINQITIENGVVTPELLPDKFQARNALSISEKDFVICHVGRFTSGDYVEGGGLSSGQKAHDTIICSFAKALEKGLAENSRLLLLGDGPLIDEAKHLAAELGVINNIKFLGLLPNAWAVLAAADVFFFPSRHEGLPNALVEAAMCGLPVVASNIPEIVNINLSGDWLLSDVDDVEGFANDLCAVFENALATRKAAVSSSALFRNAFSMDACANLYVKFYKSIVQSYENTV